MINRSLFIAFVTALLFLPSVDSDAAAPTGDELVQQGNTAFKRGKREEAISLFGQAIAVSPTNVVAYFNRGRVLAHEGRHEQAMPDYDKVIQLEPQRIMTWHLRGVSHFHLGHLSECIADFNHYLELSPGQEPYHWQRGIVFYYAGRYADGQRQFQLYHTVRSNDVENAIWHFLCVTRASSLDSARTSLLPVSGDRRVPMMQIHALYAGKAQPEDVIAATKAGNAKGDELKQRMFYADLYLGLYQEATGNVTKAREHISRAVDEAPAHDFMSDVARLQAQRLRLAAADDKAKP